MVIGRFRLLVIAIAVVIIAGFAFLGAQIWLLHARIDQLASKVNGIDVKFEETSAITNSIASLRSLAPSPPSYPNLRPDQRPRRRRRPGRDPLTARASARQPRRSRCATILCCPTAIERPSSGHYLRGRAWVASRHSRIIERMARWRRRRAQRHTAVFNLLTK